MFYFQKDHRALKSLAKKTPLLNASVKFDNRGSKKNKQHLYLFIQLARIRSSVSSRNLKQKRLENKLKGACIISRPSTSISGIVVQSSSLRLTFFVQKVTLTSCATCQDILPRKFREFTWLFADRPGTKVDTFVGFSDLNTRDSIPKIYLLHFSRFLFSNIKK